MTRRLPFGSVIATLFVALLLPAARALAQTTELPPEIARRSLMPCSAAPGLAARATPIWPGGVVPYAFDGNAMAAQQAAMRAAMKVWEGISPVRFVPRASESAYLHIKDDAGNWSHVGRLGGRQEMGIYNWNVKFQMVHVLGHALGFHHPHQRPDRDDFVTVAPTKLADPNYRVAADALALGGYDFDSVLHEASTYLTVNHHHNPVWQSRIGQRDHLSAGDVRSVQIAYGEPNRPPSEYGAAGTSTDFVPTFHTGGEFACIGNAEFQLVSRNLTGGTGGVIMIATAPASIDLAGRSIYVDLIHGYPVPLACLADGPAGIPGSGAVTFPIPLPNVPTLVGAQLFLQGAFAEPAAPFGTTAGMWLTLHAPRPEHVSCIYDREAYQRHVTSAAAGRAVWEANAVPGFDYLRTEPFTSGGQTHWMLIVAHAGTGMEFCLIPGGSFRMGDLNGTGYSGERPVHCVHVEPFLLARTEVTQAQFLAVMGTEPWKGKPDARAGATNAASYVDWFDAATLCAKLGMQLPTEAQWEYACRGGTATCYPFGENYPPSSLSSHAWYAQNATASERYVHPVGQKLPNAFGLYDMLGNVWEWCLDDWKGDYRRIPTNGAAWSENDAGARPITRGGCYYSDARTCRSAFRVGVCPVDRRCGVRPARALR